MDRARSVPLAVAAATLLVGLAALRLLTGPDGTGVRPYREVAGFALATPAGLVALTYFGGVFRFEDYYADRSAGSLALDFGLAVALAAAVGSLAVAVAVQLDASPAAVFVAATTLAFVGAMAAFFVRTRGFLE